MTVEGLLKVVLMRVFSRFLRIIGLWTAGLLLASCSAVKLGYNQLPEIAFWWIDSYIDVADAQTPRLRRELDDIAAWHRAQELPELAALLKKAQRMASGPITAEQACALFEEGRQRFNAVTTRGEGLVLWLSASLTPAQIDHLAQKYAKINKEWDAEWARGTPAEQLRHREKKAVERFEMVYGDLDEAQLRVLRAGLVSSSYDARTWGQERLRRQDDILQTLRQINASPMPPEAVRTSMRALLDRLTTSPTPAGRAYAEKTLRENCALFANVHNSTTTAQRARAVETLGRYESDFRALAAAR